MREIKFRVFEPLNKKMHYVNLALMTKDDNFILPLGKQSLNDKYTVMNLDSVKIMQFTGLKDKNSKEIYEGDILQLESWTPENMQVLFIEGAFCLCNKDGEYSGDIHYIQHADNNQSVVVGNIYENPELLK